MSSCGDGIENLAIHLLDFRCSQAPSRLFCKECDPSAIVRSMIVYMSIRASSSQSRSYYPLLQVFHEDLSGFQRLVLLDRSLIHLCLWLGPCYTRRVFSLQAFVRREVIHCHDSSSEYWDYHDLLCARGHPILFQPTDYGRFLVYRRLTRHYLSSDLTLRSASPRLVRICWSWFLQDSDL